MDSFSKSNFSTMKKYFSSGFFLNIKSLIIAFQRTQPELLGVSERETATGTKDPPPSGPSLRNYVHMKSYFYRACGALNMRVFRTYGGPSRIIMN